jgi:ABC-type multidrug transport system fused ATPase/permease subunit
MQHLPKLLAQHRFWLFCRLVVNGLAQAGALIATAWLIKITFDAFITPNGQAPTASLVWCAGGLAGAALAIALLRMLELVDAEKLGQDYTHEIRVELFKHMCQLSPRLLQQRSRGGIILRFIGDLNALKQWVSLGVARLTVASVTTLVTLSILATVNVDLAILVGIALALGAVASFSLGVWLRNAVREARRQRARLAANVSEKIAALSVVQTFGQSHREKRRVDRQSEQLMHAMVKRARYVGGFRGIVELTAAAASSGVLLLGTVLVVRNEITAGTVVAAMSIVGLLLPALRDLGRVQEYWHTAQVSKEKIYDFISLPPMNEAHPETKPLAAGPGQLVFQNIQLANGVNNFSASVQPGGVVAVVGPSGAGKSTLLSLAARVIAPDSGHVFIDGQDIATVSNESLRLAVGMMTPDLPLLRGSIERNLRYRYPKASSEALQHAIKLCHVEEIINKLPHGLKTRVSEDGINLSLGQRQRIGLARALLGEPRILLLDEVDANLDLASASVLRRILAEYPGTVLLVTHRLDWVRLADQIWHLENGSLLETGTPAELLASDSATARLFARPRLVG